MSVICEGEQYKLLYVFFGVFFLKKDNAAFKPVETPGQKD